MKKKISIALIFVLLFLVAIIVRFDSYYNCKINDNLPEPVTSVEKDEADVNSLTSNFSFSEFINLNVTFLSGAGGWSTELTIAEDGSMYGMVVNQRGAKLTKERVYELLEIVMNCRKY